MSTSEKCEPGPLLFSASFTFGQRLGFLDLESRFGQAQNFLLAAFMSSGSSYRTGLGSGSTPSPAAHARGSWMRRRGTKSREAEDAAGILFWLHCCCFCFSARQPACLRESDREGLRKSEGVGRWVGFFGLAEHKNYYRPNKRYFSRDECALVRVLFYFFELLPAS